MKKEMSAENFDKIKKEFNENGLDITYIENKEFPSFCISPIDGSYPEVYIEAGLVLNHPQRIIEQLLDRIKSVNKDHANK